MNCKKGFKHPEKVVPFSPEEHCEKVETFNDSIKCFLKSGEMYFSFNECIGKVMVSGSGSIESCEYKPFVESKEYYTDSQGKKCSMPKFLPDMGSVYCEVDEGSM